MADTIKPKFTFESKALDKNTFTVVKFKGTEGLSTMYHFNITLISEKADLDLDAILQNPVEFTIKRSDGDIPFNGILSSFEQLHQAGGVIFYRAELVPKLWWTTLTHCNQIFLNENPQGFLNDALQNGGLKQGLNFDFKLQGSYPTWEYLCQYNESNFNFVSRWMERDGMYYYFEQTDQGEKMIITDTHIAHSPMSEGTSLTYSPPSNLDHAKRDEIVKNFMLKQQPMPKTVLLKDYNYQKPSLEMKCQAPVSSKGMGEIYIYAEHFKTISEGDKLAKIRAQEYLCREKVFHGVSTVPYVRSGYVFELKDHYRQDFNQRYLTTEIVHEGSQEAYLVSGLGLNLEQSEDKLYYRNSFTCIPAATQFRAERKTSKPKFSGSMNAKVDASGSGKYAELDSQGRYKVILPFDESGRQSGKATTWLRMAQPYGGPDHGMHFPLHKGTEVLLTCIDGDPDRPIIQAAVPNPETPSLVTDNNQTKCIIATGGLNTIHMQDQAGSEGVHVKSPTKNTYVRLGAADPDSTPSKSPEDELKKTIDEEIEKKNKEAEEEDSLVLQTEGNIKIGGKNIASYVLGNESKVVVGFANEAILGNDFKFFAVGKEDVVIALETGLSMGGELKFTPLHTVIHEDETKLKGTIAEVAGEKIHTALEVTKLDGTKTTLSAELNTLRGNHDALDLRHSLLVGMTSSLIGTSNKLAGQIEAVHGEVTTVAGLTSHLCSEVTELSGDKSSIIGVSSKGIGSSLKSIGESSEVVGETSKIAGEMNNIAGLITMV